MPDRHDLVIASNRGPVSFGDTGEPRRGVGGLVTAVTDALSGSDAVWVCMAISEEDRARADRPLADEPAPGIETRFLALPPSTFDGYYEEASNRALWFAIHGLGALTVADDAWRAYEEANAAVAAAIDVAASPRARVLVQDYHLCLVPLFLRARRPDLRIGLAWHIPFATPEGWRALPVADRLLDGMDAADAVTFHATRWADRFDACRGARAHARTVVLPLGVDPIKLHELADAPASRAHDGSIAGLVGDRRLVLRVDRVEPAKGVPAGLRAFERMLERAPDLVDGIVHLCRLTPSRLGVPEYAAELAAIRADVARIRERFGDVIILEVEDDLDRTLAAYRRADVLAVTSIADGMNLVAREGPILSERDLVLVLSSETGAADELPGLLVDPHDIDAIAAALEMALRMPDPDRAQHAAAVRAAAPGLAPADWLRRQLDLLA